MEPQIYLAPLKGLTDAIFRTAYAECFEGIDIAVTPFISTTKSARIKPSLLKEVRPENNQRLPIVPQIISKTATHFIPLAKALYDLGHPTVNWNLGCPFPMVAKKRRGSGLLPYPDAVDAFLEETMAAIPNRFSIKMRLGRFAAQEIYELLPVLNRYPLKEIIIHPRTGVQMYKGSPDLHTFENCLPQTPHRVIYNGDIVTADDFKRLQSRFASIDTWMIGRGVVANPFLPALIKGRNQEAVDPIALLRKFHDLLYNRYAEILFGPSHLTNKMKGFWLYFSKSFKNGHRILKQVQKTRKTELYRNVVDRFFDRDAQWQAEMP